MYEENKTPVAAIPAALGRIVPRRRLVKGSWCIVFHTNRLTDWSPRGRGLASRRLDDNTLRCKLSKVQGSIFASATAFRLCLCLPAAFSSLLIGPVNYSRVTRCNSKARNNDTWMVSRSAPEGHSKAAAESHWEGVEPKAGPGSLPPCLLQARKGGGGLKGETRRSPRVRASKRISRASALRA
ncbi:hypothetical protein K437DRAFT_128245 [Tilletiaria anomala UBC 951]|uniref:Uncharacterized protein n=1 Tax=Tilletiaria anomala (strain ATCC 24038 / CBS 436.72 / UBC 951) TaxID=1037660 RepID=A0A066VTW6_TILAU|nr:uncharacterized protein K437DRAFT_128245 [Tilletiaria anomala UBC 951]KDN44891.1 hypothetical protein K437DRAFT_128245 [Tilletiaria anomala UBC 951]